MAGEPSAGQTQEARDMTLSGRVEELGLADILGKLLRSRETALVTLQREAVSKCVHVHQGRVMFAQSGDRDDRLGEVLLREGMISAEQYDQSGRLIRPGKRQGTILVELGYITPTELMKGVKLQVEHVVKDLLSWRQGLYRIEMRELDTSNIITLNISTENLLFDGIKKGAGWSQILRGLGGTMDSVLHRVPEGETRLYKLDLSEDETHVVALVNGRLSAAQICSMSYLSNHDTCLVLHGLACCGIIEAGRARDPEAIFREQVAEAEMQDVNMLVAQFNDAVVACRAEFSVAFGALCEAELAGVMDVVADEHWDVLRHAKASEAGVDARVIVDNIADIETGTRRMAVERALDGAREGIVRRARAAAGDAVGDRIAALLAPVKESA